MVASIAERRTLATAPPRTTFVAAMPLAAISVPPPVPPLVPAVPVCDWNEAPPEAVTVLTTVAEMSAASLARTARSACAVTVASVMRAVAPPFTSLNTMRPPNAFEEEAGVRAVGTVAPAAGGVAGVAGGAGSATLSSCGSTVRAGAGIQLSLR
ncbi:hypothetical protein LDDCCGHA_3263 [Methylobacterium oxalidis]|nr:hypothetical protein LDDCCGHA_3263 [Methylobacterium oxalidis]